MTLKPPTKNFQSAGGRKFTVEDGARRERDKDDPRWSESWPIQHNGRPAGKLFRNLDYGTTASGEPRWQATTRELYWREAADAPLGIGFDVAAFDSADEALAAWGRSADQILDWAAGKPVKSVYSKTGEVRRGR